MEPLKLDSQVDTLYHHLRNGMKIDRVSAFRMFGIADIRSRICNVEKRYGVTIDREKVEDKRYLRYFIKEKQLTLFV